MDRSLDVARKFLQKNSVNYPAAMVDEATREAFGGVPALPLTILVDCNGVIRKEKLGHRSNDVARLERKIQDLLGES